MTASGCVLILAGGGGHTGYAAGLAQALSGKVDLSFIVPEDDALSFKKLSKFGEVTTLLKPRGPRTPRVQFGQRLAKAFADSVGKVTRKNSVVVSTGSNFCIPPATIAWIKNIPIVNIESSVRFTKASRTAVLLKPLSKLTALQWEEQRQLLDGTVVGPIIQRPDIKPWNGGYILVTGGTFGHRLLFEAIKESALHNVVLQTGQIDPAPFMKAHPEWKVIALTEKFNELLAGADVVVTHFGSTVLEAVSYRKPVVLILNPEWTRTVGFADAQRLAEKVNAAFVSKITSKSIVDAIDAAKKLEIPTLPNGAENLANRILQMLRQRVSPCS